MCLRRWHKESILIILADVSNSLLWLQSHLPTWQQRLLLYTQESLPCSHGDDANRQSCRRFHMDVLIKSVCWKPMERHVEETQATGSRVSLRNRPSPLNVSSTSDCFFSPAPPPRHRLVQQHKWVLLKSVNNYY